MTDVQTTPEGTCLHGHRGTPRRALFAGAGAVGAACLLSACGSDSGGTGQNEPGFTTNPAPAGSATPGAATGGATTGSSGGGSALAAKGDVPVGGGVIKGELVITQPQAGTYKAFSKVCTHQGCPVSAVDNGAIICRCHNSQFSITDGSVKSGPARQPLPETKVKLDGDNIVPA